MPKGRASRAALVVVIVAGGFQIIPLSMDAPSFPLPATDRLSESRRPTIAQPADLPSIGHGVSIANVQQLHRIFTRAEYRLDHVRDAAATVPRIYLARFPAGMAEMEPADERKALFLRVVLPLILRVNLEIEVDRIRARYLLGRLVDGEGLSRRDERWLVALSRRYKVLGVDDDIASLDAAARARLLRRIDGFPPSLVLAQAAVESGWGTSRFATVGNALFGQWTWDESAGIAPTERDDGEGHAIRAFDSLLDSVRAYAHNLNTHPSYADFRAARRQTRVAQSRLNSLLLSRYLQSYSERREAYIEELIVVIQQNQLQDFDQARL